MSFLFKKPPKKKTTRLFFATDLHGLERTYRKFLNTGKFYNAEVLIMGEISLENFSFPSLRKRMGITEQHFKGRQSSIAQKQSSKVCWIAWEH